MMMNKVGILGSGDVGKTLAKAFLETGYEVKLGTRSPEKLESWINQQTGKKENVAASSGTFEETASYGELTVLAVQGAAAEEAVRLAGPRKFSGKLVIDATNPLDFSKGMPPGQLQAYVERSLGETLQDKLQDAQVVKSFNTIPHTQMFHPKPKDAQLLICGNDSSAKEEVTRIAKQFGWSGTIDAGGIESARYLESLVVLWVRVAAATQAWDSMFMLVK
jgi:predicted dinucleotide-binding enzyme